MSYGDWSVILYIGGELLSSHSSSSHRHKNRSKGEVKETSRERNNGKDIFTKAFALNRPNIL